MQTRNKLTVGSLLVMIVGRYTTPYRSYVALDSYSFLRYGVLLWFFHPHLFHSLRDCIFLCPLCVCLLYQLGKDVCQRITMTMSRFI